MRKSVLMLIAFLTLLGGAAAMATIAIVSDTVLAGNDDCDSSGSGSGGCDDNGSGDQGNDESGNHGGQHGDDERDAGAQTALAQPVGEREIRIIDERYVPNTIAVQAGQSVTFVNADDDEHTATGPGFDTGTMLAGDSVTIAFDTPGTYDFVCQFHSEMRGTVTVEGDGTPVASPAASPAAAETPVQTAAGTAETMGIVDFAFAEPEITVRPGTTVTWTNEGAAPHTVTGLADASGTLDPGQSFSFTFDTPGVYAYQCSFHPQMKGTVTVDPNAPQGA